MNRSPWVFRLFVNFSAQNCSAKNRNYSMKIWIIIIRVDWSVCLLDDKEFNSGCETSSFFKDSIKIHKQFGFRVIFQAIKLKNHERQLNLSVSIRFNVSRPIGIIIAKDFTLKSSIIICYYYAKDLMKYSGSAVAETLLNFWTMNFC